MWLQIYKEIFALNWMVFDDFFASLIFKNITKMETYDIITLTINPALDKSTHFKGLVAEQKIRCEEPRFDAGGGGINVSKAISRLGGNSLAVFTSGGPLGKMLEQLIEKESIDFKAIPIKTQTR